MVQVDWQLRNKKMEILLHVKSNDKTLKKKIEIFQTLIRNSDLIKNIYVNKVLKT